MPLMMMPDTKMYDINPKVIEVDQLWINKFAKLEKTKDVDILHKLCKPTFIPQDSNGEKSYIYVVQGQYIQRIQCSCFSIQ